MEHIKNCKTCEETKQNSSMKKRDYNFLFHTRVNKYKSQITVKRQRSTVLEYEP